MEIMAKKKIELKSFQAICTNKFQVGREDIQWILSLLKNPQKMQEFRNLLYYLQTFYGLLDDNLQLTHDGLEAIKTGRIFQPESGLYRILYLEDPLLSPILTVISVQALKMAQEIPEANESLANFGLFIEIDWKPWVSNSEYSAFRIEFTSKRNTTPLIIKEESNTSLEMGIRIKENSIDFGVHGANFQNPKDLVKRLLWCQDVHQLLLMNIKHLYTCWDDTLQAVVVSWDEIKDSPDKIKNFKKDDHFESTLQVATTTDPAIWDISLNSIPIFPKDQTESEKWFRFLFKEEILSWKGYYTNAYLFEKAKLTYEKTPFKKKYSLPLKKKDMPSLFDQKNPHEKEIMLEIAIAEILS